MVCRWHVYVNLEYFPAWDAVLFVNSRLMFVYMFFWLQMLLNSLISHDRSSLRLYLFTSPFLLFVTSYPTSSSHTLHYFLPQGLLLFLYFAAPSSTHGRFFCIYFANTDTNQLLRKRIEPLESQRIVDFDAQIVLLSTYGQRNLSDLGKYTVLSTTESLASCMKQVNHSRASFLAVASQTLQSLKSLPSLLSRFFCL